MKQKTDNTIAPWRRLHGLIALHFTFNAASFGEAWVTVDVYNLAVHCGGDGGYQRRPLSVL